MKNYNIYFIISLIIFYNCSDHAVDSPANSDTTDTAVTLFLDTLKTVNSLTRVQDFYVMSFYGDYSDILEQTNNTQVSLVSGSGNIQSFPSYNCTLFSTLKSQQRYLFGRNFDSIPADLLVYYCAPPNGARSVALTPTWHFGFSKGADLTALSYQQKLALLTAPYYPVEGMNEHGISVGVASVAQQDIVLNPDKDSIFLTYWMRKILDKARTLQDAVDITQDNNVFSTSLTTLDVHMLVADSTGNSVILEYYNGEMRALPNEEPFQIVTNTSLYGRTTEQLMTLCWRYQRSWETLQPVEGNITVTQGLNLLEYVSLSGTTPTQWSTLFNISTREFSIVTYKDYSNPVTLSLFEAGE